MATSSSAYASGSLVGEQRARDEQTHRHETRRQTGQVHTLRAEAAGQPGTQQRTGDRGDDLRQEHRAVLAAGEVVLIRIGEDRARRGKRHEDDALDEAGHVDDVGLRAGGHRRTVGYCRRSAMWAPTRMALAIAVNAGFTAPMLGKKLVSTT